MTLDCVEISLARVFESGQAYVALSRARSLEGLRVMDFDPRVVHANSDVLMFYKKLKRDRLLLQVSSVSLCYPVTGGEGDRCGAVKISLQEGGKLKDKGRRWIVCGRQLDSVFRMTHYTSKGNFIFQLVIFPKEQTSILLYEKI